MNLMLKFHFDARPFLAMQKGCVWNTTFLLDPNSRKHNVRHVRKTRTKLSNKSTGLVIEFVADPGF